MKDAEEGCRGGSELSQQQQGSWWERRVLTRLGLWEGTIMAAAWVSASPHPAFAVITHCMPEPLSPFVHCLQIPPPPMCPEHGMGTPMH